MAEVACEHSDKVIFTSDNPRSEDPAQIIKDMEEGLTCCSKKKIYLDRRQERSDKNSDQPGKAGRYCSDSRKRT